MRYLIIFLSIFTQNAWTQQEDIDLIEAVILTTKTLSDLNKADNLCSDPSSNEEMVCSTSNSIDTNDYETFMLKYESFEDLPAEIKSEIPGTLLEGIDTKGAVKLVIALPNDNKFFAMWGMIFNDDGNDWGFTHGLSIDVSRTNKKGITTTFHGSSNLYTEKILNAEQDFVDDKGTEHKAGFFTNESLLKLVVDNKAKNNLLYYKVGVGWHHLDSSSTSFLSGAWLQKSMHHVMLKANPTAAHNPIYVRDGSPSKDSLQLESFFGLQKNFVFGQSSCRIRTYAQVGSVIDTFSTNFQTEAGVYFFYQKPRKKTALMIGGSGNFSVFKNGTNLNMSSEIGIQKGRTQLSLGYSQIVEKLHNYNSLNQGEGRYAKEGDAPRIDAIATIKLGIILGKTRR